LAISQRRISSFRDVDRSESLILMKHIVLFLIRGYKRTLSPLFGQHCRFFPSCSDYTYEAIEKHGLVKGLYLGTKRLLKCHPLHSGGVDPIP